MRTILKEKVAVNCKTEEEAKEFLAMLDKDGYMWSSGDKLTNNSHWIEYRGRTCYGYKFMGSGEIGFADIDVYKSICEIISFVKFKQSLNLQPKYSYIWIDEFVPTISEHLICGNKTIVKLSNGKIGIVECDTKDKFNEGIGVVIAVARAYGVNLKEIVKLIDKPKEKELFYAKDIVGKWAVNKTKDWGSMKYKILFVTDKSILTQQVNGWEACWTVKEAFGKTWEVVE